MFNAYPHEDFHVLNVDWLIKKYKELAERYEVLLKGFEDVKTDFDELRAEFDSLSEEFKNLLNVIEEKISEITDTKISDAMANYRGELEALRQVVELHTSSLSELNSLILQYREEGKSYTDEEIEKLRLHLESQISSIEHDIQELQWSLPEVYNLTRGVWTKLVTCLYDVYDACRDDALTALEYDSLYLTASDFDSRGLTSYKFDTDGREILMPCGYCRNPVTGEYAPICDILFDMMQELTHSAITAGEYDALELTAQGFDSIGISAYGFDYFGKMLLTEGG